MNFFINLIVLLVSLEGDAVEPGEVEDFCKWEPFEPKCRSDEAIIMLGAKYGRMKLGRCVKQDLGELGCHADVIELMDEACSGKQFCQVIVPNPDLDRYKTCSNEVTSYLEASYTCKKVIVGDASRCRSNAPFHVSSSQGILPSRITYETGCGSISSPWMLRAEAGQKFNISVWIFDKKQSNRYSKSCLKLALISDVDEEPAVICVMPNIRHQNVFLSNHHQVLIRLSPFTIQPIKIPTNFVLEFQVTGCANMQPPSTGAWIKRTNQITSIGCHGDDDVRWSVECVERRWIGAVGSCDAVRSNFTSSSRIDSLKLTSVMSLLIIISISFLIGLVVLIAGLFWMQRKRSIIRRRSSLQETAYFNKSREDKAVLGKSQVGHPQGVEFYGKKHLSPLPSFPPAFPLSYPVDPIVVCSAYSVDSVDLINSALNSTCTIHSSYNATNSRDAFDSSLCRHHHHCALDKVVVGRGGDARLKFNLQQLNDYDSINDHAQKVDNIAQQQHANNSGNKRNLRVEIEDVKDDDECVLMGSFTQIKNPDNEIFIKQHM